MKVLLFIPRLDHGGPDRVFFELARAFAEFGVATSVLVQEAGGLYWDQLPPHVERAVLVAPTNRPAAKGFPVAAFARHIRATRPDVVLCTLRSLLTAAAAVASRQVQVPLVIRPANHLTRNSRELLAQSPLKHAVSWAMNVVALHTARHVICQSQDLYADFRRYGVPARSLTVIANPIALPAQPAVPAADDTGHERTHALVAVGRLMPQKGFDLLIEAMSLVPKQPRPVSLSIFGDGPDRAALQHQIESLGLQDRVRLAGFSPRVAAEVARADMLVSSSRYEGFPNVVLEALAQGVPVVATDCPGGTRELIIEGQTGWLCAANSAPALAAAIARGLAAPRPTAVALRQFVDERYSVRVIAARYLDVLQNACRQN